MMSTRESVRELNEISCSTGVQRTDLSSFTLAGYDKGRGRAVQAAWFATQNLIFGQWWCPARFRVTILKLFGADVHHTVLVRHRVRVLWPWKLTIGPNSWIGEGVWLLNLEPIIIGADVCISQEAFLCTGSHRMRDPSFAYDNGPIEVKRGAWIGARAVILRRVKVGEDAVVSACAIIRQDVTPNAVVHESGESIGSRWRHQGSEPIGDDRSIR